MKEPSYLCKDCKHRKIIGVFMGFGTLDIECKIKDRKTSFVDCNKFKKKKDIKNEKNK